MLEEKKSFVHRAHFKTLRKQKRFQTLILGSMGLFQTIQSVLEFKMWFGNLELSKPGGLPNIYIFLYIPIQKGTFDIHLKKLKTL
jgi:hypothetical protein